MQDVVVRVSAVVGQCLATKDVDAGQTLAKLGADSLDMLDIQYHLEHEFDRELPADWLRPGQTCRDVAADLQGCRSPAGALAE